MSAIADFTVAVLDCPQCTRPFMASHVTVALHENRLVCPHCDAQWGTAADSAPTAADPGHAARRARRTRTRRADTLRLFGNPRRKLQ